MSDLSWDITAMAVAKFAFELRMPLAAASQRLLAASGINPELSDRNRDIYNDINEFETTILSDKNEAEYLAQVRRLIVQLLINLKHGRKFGSSKMDQAVIRFFNSQTGKSFKQSLIDIFTDIEYGNVQQFGEINDQIVPQTVLVSSTIPSGDEIFNHEEDGELAGGIVIRGTPLGIGEQGTVINRLQLGDVHVSAGVGSNSIDFKMVDFSRVDDVTINPRFMSSLTNASNPYDWTGFYALSDHAVPTEDLPTIAQWFRTFADYARDAGSDYWCYDSRSISYANCEWFATLPAGNYKLIAECLYSGDNTNFHYFNSDWMGETNTPWTPPWAAIVDDSNNQIFKANIMQSGACRNNNGLLDTSSMSWGNQYWYTYTSFYNTRERIFYNNGDRSAGKAIYAETHLDVGTYTFSCFIKAESATSVDMLVDEENVTPSPSYYSNRATVTYDTSTTVNVTTNMAIYSVTFTVTQAGYVAPRVVNNAISAGTLVYIACYSLVRGTQGHNPIEYSRFMHEEHSFSLAATTNIGLMHKAYYTGDCWNRNTAKIYQPVQTMLMRFMIVEESAEPATTPVSVVITKSNLTYILTGETNFTPYGDVTSVIHAKLTNILNGKEYIEEIEIPSLLTDTDVAYAFRFTEPIVAALCDVIDPDTNPHNGEIGLLKVDILETDAQGGKARITTAYSR